MINIIRVFCLVPTTWSSVISYEIYEVAHEWISGKGMIVFKEYVPNSIAFYRL